MRHYTSEPNVSQNSFITALLLGAILKEGIERKFPGTAMAASSMRKRSFVKDGKSANGSVLLGYARVSKGDEQNNVCRPRRSEPLAARSCSRRWRLAAVGTGPNCTGCSTTSARETRS
jgi:hypothetical protein